MYLKMKCKFSVNFNKVFLKKFSTKSSPDLKVKIDSFYEFMDENIKNKEKNYENRIIDDEKALLSLVKCPMTNSSLEITEEGLKIAVK